MAVTGNDLIRAGMKPGRALGEVLEQLLDQVLSDPGKNQREYLLGEGLRLWKAAQADGRT